MESLSLNDGQPYRRHLSFRRSPRLPTPEDSRSSNEALDQRPGNAALPVGETLFKSDFIMRDGFVGGSGSSTHARRDSRNTTVPHSPPYRLTDAQKPSLPPLKTVLGDKITSPPRTPSPDRMLQLSPREPSYIAATYMPPSLYPNKKQRMEPLVIPAPPYSSSRTLEPPANGASMRPDVRFPPLSAPLAQSSIDTHRNSISAYSPPWNAQHAQQQSKAYDAAASHYRTPEQTPTSVMMEHSFPRSSAFPGPTQDPFRRDVRDAHTHPGDRPTSRRSSASGCASYSMHPYERELPQTHSYQMGNRYPVPVRGTYADCRRDGGYGRPEEHCRPVNGYGQAPYPSNVPAFFMPSHYEYQHGKARKRSNLPKQSTEIMKTWFDQNITNPYPSEEQKAIFSNATGISMTQVSNWFINHRRRCPELRDKREKTRNGRDGDA